MLDFLMVSTRFPKKDKVEIYPEFMIKPTNDLMIRGGDFYAIWDEDNNTWSTDENVAIALIDREIQKKYDEYIIDNPNANVKALYLWKAGSGMIDRWHKYVQKQMRDKYKPLDEKIIFSNNEITKKDYASKRLTYPLSPGSITNYDKLMSVLYSPEERRKLEWAIGSIITGESKKIQKFIVMYGAAGTGKSTVINIIQDLFDGYYSVFDAKALGSANNVFALEAFKTNPLIAIQHDGDLSRIEDNTRLNSVVSHEVMTVNEKFKSTYQSRFNSFLFMGTNRPVKITDAKSGLIRRLIDVKPTGNLIPVKEYRELIRGVKFELGAIAWHCKEVFESDPGYYDDYIPVSMLGASNDFYNYVLDKYDIFKKDDGTSLKAAWEMYKTYCDDAKVLYSLPMRAFKEELKNYFQEFTEGQQKVGDVYVRNYYSGFIFDKFEYKSRKKSEGIVSKTLSLDCDVSIFDVIASEYPAQYAKKDETPKKKWSEVKSKLKSIDTSKLHYVKVPKNHIVIDFDLKDENGNKSLPLNLEAANRWPETYAELSKGGQGIHLHYIYTGEDVNRLSRLYSEGIEIKVFKGNSALRRRLTQCNNIPIAEISSGLPLKEEKKVVNFEGVNSEKGLRTTISKCLRKEVHDATKPNIDFIYKVLEDAYNSGMKYDVSDMKASIISFGASSSNQSEYCLKLIPKMKFKSEEANEEVDFEKDQIIFFDIEVFPNLFLIVWKAAGKPQCVRMFNPTKEAVEDLLKYKLVGFNNRRYDNHILYAAILGMNNQGIYETSKRIIEKKDGAMFREAYNISYCDVYDFSIKKQSLKKFEIELGLRHLELEMDFNEPAPRDRWEEIALYCENDVIATEAVFNARKEDFEARQLASELSGLSTNVSTNSHSTQFIFQGNKNPQLVLTDLSEIFPGYELTIDENNKRHNMYRGIDLGFGGYVYAEPGMYKNVALIDVQSMHPNSIINLGYLGEYTQNYKDLLDARVAIKHGDFESVKNMFGGKIAHLVDENANPKALSDAMKLMLNSAYGLTAASFANPFRHPDNNNNIVALRGALFMKTLQDEVQSMGYTVVHIKTDSIKIADADEKIINFCLDFAKKYGYVFEHEATYEKLCIVNNAVYVAKDASDGHWTATGAQFQVPYVFKTLFSKEKIIFQDYCETKEVKVGEMYLDLNEGLPEDEHNYHFIGRVGSFVPILDGGGGGVLLCRKEDNGEIKHSAVTGSKGYRWLEAEMVEALNKYDYISNDYHNHLVDEAIASISEYGDFEWFVD